MSTEQSERKNFEAWARREGYATAFSENAVGTDGGPVYDDSRTHAAWWSWKARASLQAPSAAEPVAWQERTLLSEGRWSHWYERSHPRQLDDPREIRYGTSVFQFRPLYAAAPAAKPLSYGRAEFETYAQQMGYRDFEETSEDGIRRYTNPFVQGLWNFWRASRDALAAAQGGGDAL